MLTYDWLKNNVVYVNRKRNKNDEYRSYTIGPKNKDDYNKYRFNTKKVNLFNIRLSCILYLITKSKVYRENVENDINIEELILVDTEKLRNLNTLDSSSLYLTEFQEFITLNTDSINIISHSKAISLFVWITTSFFNLNSVCSDVFRIYKESYISHKDFFLGLFLENSSITESSLSFTSLLVLGSEPQAIIILSDFLAHSSMCFVLFVFF